jgi:hypothetical protein
MTRDTALAVWRKPHDRGRKRGTLMWDIVFVLMIVLFFAIAIGYTQFCDRMH